MSFPRRSLKQKMGLWCFIRFLNPTPGVRCNLIKEAKKAVGECQIKVLPPELFLSYASNPCTIHKSLATSKEYFITCRDQVSRKEIVKLNTLARAKNKKTQIPKLFSKNSSNFRHTGQQMNQSVITWHMSYSQA